MSPELLVEEKKMEDEDLGGYADGRTNSVWRGNPPFSSSRGGGHASFGMLSSITGSYDLQSLGQSEDDDKEDDREHKEEEGSAMLRPSSSNVS